MSKNVLITGGAGFIGSHLADKLIQEKKYNVTVLDILEEQVHGKVEKAPDYLNKEVKFLKGSVNDEKTLKELFNENEIIFHLAAMVGVAQSMYRIHKYTDHNILGTANLLNIIVNCEHNIEKLIIASSNTIYGESKSYCSKCGVVFPKLRPIEQLEKKDWELDCPKCGLKVKPSYTDEDSPLDPSSIYAFTKQAQEKMSLLIGETYDIDTTVLRFFLVYGQRQALLNPYTGVCSIFSSRLLSGKPPTIFEDGLQTRDFVNVKDVCQALNLAMLKNSSKGKIYNVGSGESITIKEVAEILAEKINPELKPLYKQQYRVGDIRHCVADISKISRELGYHPTISFKEGIDEFIEWIKIKGSNIQDYSNNAIKELKEKGLLK